MADIVEELGTISEGTTGQITFTIEENGVGLQPTTLSITLYDEETGTIIGGRDNSTLSPVSNYVTGLGVLTYNLIVGESNLVSTDVKKVAAYHRVVFKWTWSGGARVGYFVGRWLVEPTDIEVT